MKITRPMLFALTAATLLLSACTPSTQNSDQILSGDTDNKALQIVTTFPPLYQHTLNLIDDNETVTNLVPAGTSVHTRQPTPQDILKLQNADMIIINGLGLEEFLDDYLDDLSDKGVMIVNTGEGIDTMEYDHDDDDDHEHDDHDDDDHDDDHDHHHSGTDPHVWLNVVHALSQINSITAALSEADPAQSSVYTDKSITYTDKLTALHNDIEKRREQAMNIKPFIVFHDAYSYYTHAYDIEDYQLGVIHEHHNDVPTQAEIADLIEDIRETGAVKVCIEPQFNSSIVDAIQKEADVEVVEIDPIGSQMDADGYIENMKAITNALIQ